MQQFFRKDRPRIPSELLEVTEEDYAKSLRDGGFSERLIEKELERLRTFQARYQPAPKPVVIGVTDEGNPMVQAFMRRKGKKRRVTEVEDGEEIDG